MHCSVQYQQEAWMFYGRRVASLAGWLTQKLLTKVTPTAHVRKTSTGQLWGKPPNGSYALIVCFMSWHLG